jgi:PhzF family phenazine biosynthesis protein
MSQTIHRVNAFTERPDEGNPAGVLADARGRSDDEMQAIARWVNLSETAFVLPATVPEAAFRLRWFTPTTEVHLCGHATVAALHVLAAEGRVPRTGTPVRIETLSGLLEVRVDEGLHCLQIPVPEFTAFDVPLDELDRLYGLKPTDLDPALPAVAVENEGAFIPIRSLERLHGLAPDFERMKRGAVLDAACLFTRETVEPANAWHLRFFAPRFGIDEDPVTGAVNGPMGAYVYQHVMPDASGPLTFTGEQGDILGRRGRVMVRVEGDGGRATRIDIGGRAVLVESVALPGSTGLP